MYSDIELALIERDFIAWCSRKKITYIHEDGLCFPIVEDIDPPAQKRAENEEKK